MASGLNEEEIEMQEDYRNKALPSSRSPAEAKGGVTPAVPGRKLLRVVAVSFGLLCVLQAALNIYLRFTLSHQREENQQIHNSTMLQLQEIKSHDLMRERDQLQASYDDVTRERDQLQTLINNLSQIKGLRCPLGWKKFQSSCYFVSMYRANWNESRQECLLRGANLVIINSRGEQAFLKDLQDRFWIGLSDLDNEGQWRWVDGTGLAYRIWAPEEPNDEYGGEDCVELLQKFNAWNDASCSAMKHSVCEKLVST
ncbi:hepatic lectin-like isoform X1 [Genypterus blacodes]|uniref:hepatic lectin-like isoform X1 n=1 Tax=Genypterus blacodes TaxID=154954 RepID=UPI003F76F989